VDVAQLPRAGLIPRNANAPFHPQDFLNRLEETIPIRKMNLTGVPFDFSSSSQLLFIERRFEWKWGGCVTKGYIAPILCD